MPNYLGTPPASATRKLFGIDTGQSQVNDSLNELTNRAEQLMREWDFFALAAMPSSKSAGSNALNRRRKY
jgi:hypothetical protein